MSKARFEALDGLRGVAALTVVLHHCSGVCFAGGPVPRGYLAVDLFFVLSGFVIAASYEPRLADGTMTKVEFIKVRLVRLYPLYLVGLCLGLLPLVLSLFARTGIANDAITAWLSLPFSLLMAPSPFSRTGDFFPLDWPVWSLFFELVVNLVYVFTRRFWTIPTLLVVMLASAAIVLLRPDDGRGGYDWVSIDYGFARVFYSFPAGVLIYRLYALGVRAPKIPSWLIVALFPLAIQIPGFWGVRLSMLVLFPLTVALGTRAGAGGWLRPVWVQAGALSYALYVIHGPAIVLLGALAKRLQWTPPPLAIGAAFVALLLGISVLLDRFFDSPVRGAMSRWFKVGSKQPSVVSSAAKLTEARADGLAEAPALEG